MTATVPAFHWFLPTGGDDRTMKGSTHGGTVGAYTDRISPGLRPPSLDYLIAVARAAESLGFDGVLMPTGAHVDSAWKLDLAHFR